METAAKNQRKKAGGFFRLTVCRVGSAREKMTEWGRAGRAFQEIVWRGVRGRNSPGGFCRVGVGGCGSLCDFSGGRVCGLYSWCGSWRLSGAGRNSCKQRRAALMQTGVTNQQRTGGIATPSGQRGAERRKQSEGTKPRRSGTSG